MLCESCAFFRQYSDISINSLLANLALQKNMLDLTTGQRDLIISNLQLPSSEYLSLLGQICESVTFGEIQATHALFTKAGAGQCGASMDNGIYITGMVTQCDKYTGDGDMAYYQK